MRSGDARAQILRVIRENLAQGLELSPPRHLAAPGSSPPVPLSVPESSPPVPLSVPERGEGRRSPSPEGRGGQGVRIHHFTEQLSAVGAQWTFVRSETEAAAALTRILTDAGVRRVVGSDSAVVQRILQAMGDGIAIDRLEQLSRDDPFACDAGVAALVIYGCGGSGAGRRGSRADAGRQLKIAVIPKGTTHEFWKSIHAGAIQASRELTDQGTPVDIIWKGPLREDDREQQIQVVEGFLSQGVQGIVLAPLDSRALVRPVEEARRAGVPTVVIDSRLESDSIVSFVATDNHKGGQLAAGRLGELLGGKGKVLLLRYAEGSASTTERDRGVLGGL